MSDTPHILVFGSRGQVGSRLLETLAMAGYEVTGIDRTRCDFATATAKDIAVIVRAIHPALIINAAAYTAVDKAEEETELAQRINGEVPEMIAAAAAESHVPLIHFSTDYVFDGLRGAPYSEDAPTNPLSAYGRSKLAGEQAVLKQGGHVFRLQWVFDSRGKNFLLTMKRFMAEKPELRVVADQIGAPSNALHIAEAITAAVPKIIDSKLPAGLYHMTAAGHTSWHGFATAIAEALKSPAQVLPIVTAEYPLPATRPKDGRLSVRALAAHGITMPHWRDGLTQAIKDLHAHS